MNMTTTVLQTRVDCLVDFAEELGRTAMASSSPARRKLLGQVFTPPAVARFMAAQFSSIPTELRLLDPGAGTGILSAAVCERILGCRTPRRVTVTAFESDLAVNSLLTELLGRCELALRDRGHIMHYEIVTDDFLHTSSIGAQRGLFDTAIGRRKYNAVIVNPPYFKINASSAYTRSLQNLTHGQPNVYSLFLAAAAETLEESGELVAITPRSFCSGSYFRAFRRWYFERMSLERVHLFESRTETFREAKILQESVITTARRSRARGSTVRITRSRGRDLSGDLDAEHVPVALAIDNSMGDSQLRIPERSIDTNILTEVERWPHRFEEVGLRISTGPVVTFRTLDYLRPTIGDGSVPLLLVHNVRPFRTEWPLSRPGKPEAFEESHDARRHLVKTANYVLLRRFSAKEERRRLTASCLWKHEFRWPRIALENHLNYIYHESRALTDDELHGIAALFNSVLMDRYFRAISGNTQVNATEVRKMRFPSLDVVARIGECMKSGGELTHAAADKATLEVLCIVDPIAAYLKGQCVEQD